MPFKCFRCCIAKKEERKAGGGVGWRPAREPRQFVWCFFFECVVVVFYGSQGGGVVVIVHIVCFIEWNPKGRCNRMVFQWARRVVWLNGFDQGILVN